MATIADLNAITDEALEALENANHARVIVLCNKALMIIPTIPKTSFDGGDMIEFKPGEATQAIESIKADAQWNLYAGKSMVQTVKQRWKRG